MPAQHTIALPLDADLMTLANAGRLTDALLAQVVRLLTKQTNPSAPTGPTAAAEPPTVAVTPVPKA